jgi:hypothetical protein
MKNKITGISAVLVIVLLACPWQAGAQSVFGLNFIGEHNNPGGARYSAIGYSGIAVPDTSGALTMNPASLAGIRSFTFSLYEVTSMSRVNTADQTSDQTRYQLPSVMAAFPVSKGLVLGIGYRTRFSGKAEFSYPAEVDFTPVPEELYKFHSSLFSVPFTVAWAPLEWLSVSGSVQLEKGSIKDEVYSSFDDTAYKDTQSIRTRGFSGTSLSASALVKAHPRLWLGASFDEAVDYSVEETIKYTLERLNTRTTYDFTLPAAWSLGAAFGISERWWATSSFWMRGAPGTEGFNQFEGSLGDETVVSFGVERRGSAEGHRWARIPLRLGYYEDRWHVEIPDGNRVVSRFFSVGSGFGMPGGPGGLDVTLEFGKIGSVSDNAIDEKVFRVGIGMSLSEKWTKRRVERH